MEDYIFQVEVPQREESVVKNGQRKMVKQNLLPGYVLVRMELTDEFGRRAQPGSHRLRRSRTSRRHSRSTRS
jgi:transcription antitermination factor NusG